MGIVTARKIEEISKATDTKQAIIKAVGDISEVDIYFNYILVGTYVPPEKTKGGIILTSNTKGESEFQGKVGVVLKKGKMAFKDDTEVSFQGEDVEVGDWVVYRAGDGWALTINGTPCRMLQDRSIRMRVKKPEDIF